MTAAQILGARAESSKRLLSDAAAVVQGVRACALVADLGRANWWLPGRHHDAALTACGAPAWEPATRLSGAR